MAAPRLSTRKLIKDIQDAPPFDDSLVDDMYVLLDDIMEQDLNEDDEDMEMDGNTEEDDEEEEMLFLDDPVILDETVIFEDLDAVGDVVVGDEDEDDDEDEEGDESESEQPDLGFDLAGFDGLDTPPFDLYDESLTMPPLPADDKEVVIEKTIDENSMGKIQGAPGPEDLRDFPVAKEIEETEYAPDEVFVEGVATAEKREEFVEQDESEMEEGYDDRFNERNLMTTLRQKSEVPTLSVVSANDQLTSLTAIAGIVAIMTLLALLTIRRRA